MTDDHLNFSLKYGVKVIEYFPGLVVHFRVLTGRLLEAIALHRGISPDHVVTALPAVVRPLATAGSA